MNILLIEDNKKISDLISKGLSCKEYKIDTALDGEKGLAKALSFDYDLIILDVMLPKLNGVEVCESYRKKGKKTPVLMLSARDSQKDQERGLTVGANDYMVKPFLFEDLYEKIDELVSSKKKATKKEVLKNIAERQLKIEFQTEKSAAVHGAADKVTNKILDNAPMSIITIDKEGNITSANKYFLRFSKSQDFSKVNIFKSSFFIREGLVEDYKKLLKDGQPLKRENCYEKNAKGEDKYLKILAVPLRDENGNIEGILSMAQDNTEVVTYKNKLEKYNRELEEMVRERTAELDQANSDLALALESKSRFMSDISHEMRTSLSIIQGHLEIFSLNNILPPDSKESYEQIKNEAKRMSVMLRDLNMLSKSESLEDEMVFEKFSLNKLLKSLYKSLGPLAMDKGIKMDLLDSDTKAMIKGDKQKIETLFLNLLKNAIKYNDSKDGIVKTQIKEVKEGYKVSVEDNGVGIDKKDQPRIFERFYRVDESRSPDNGGYGLGLAICKWVVDKHSGSIDLESELGKGSRFEVFLPKT